MLSMNSCQVFHPQDCENDADQSNLFCFPPIDLMAGWGKVRANLVCRAARIEVTDEKDDLHTHTGVTLAFVSAGTGILKTISEELPITSGDWFYIPPGVPHLNIAAKGTAMVVQTVYIGAPDDNQVSHPFNFGPAG